MRRRGLAATAVTVVALFLVLRSCSHPSGRSLVAQATATTRPEAVGGVGPSGERFGLPVGWAHTPAGARAAAIGAVHATGLVARAGFVTRDDLLSTLATTRYRAELVRTSTDQLDQLLAPLGAAGIPAQQLLFDEFPLTARVDRADDTTATVEVWSVLVAGVANHGPARQVWRTVIVSLAWERDDWHLDGWAARPGPTPMLTDTDIATTATLTAVTAWPTVGAA